MGKTKRTLKKIGFSALALIILSMEVVDDATGLTSFRGKRGIYNFAKKLNMGEYSFQRTLRMLEGDGSIRRTDEGLLITPRGLRKAKNLEINRPKKVFIDKNWNSKWYIVIFDIPEDLKSRRNTFRAFLKRKGFIRLQNSVFVCPMADLAEIDFMRRELGIEKYVHFLIAEIGSLDNDSLLRRAFSEKG